MSGAAGKRTSSKARSGLMASLEELLNKEDLLNPETFAKADNSAKMTMIVDAINNINIKFSTVHEIINEASDGLDPRTLDCEEKIQGLTDENQQLKFELKILKGAFFKLEAENSNLRERVVSLNSHSMKNNLTIGGLIANESMESPIDTVFEFFTDVMNLDVLKTQIHTAKRIGIQFKPNRPRIMVVHLQPDLKKLILSNLKSLKGKVNANKMSYSIAKQVPDQWAEENRQLKDAAQRARKQNDARGETEEKDVIEVKRGVLYINKIQQKLQPLAAPKT